MTGFQVFLISNLQFVTFNVYHHTVKKDTFFKVSFLVSQYDKFYSSISLLSAFVSFTVKAIRLSVGLNLRIYVSILSPTCKIHCF